MNICVFGASSDIIEDKYIKSAYNLGLKMAENGIGLVFGGGSTGVMGASARGVYDGGGYILGVAPHFMKQYNVLYDKCTEFMHTETMAERKTYMEDHADAFIIAPGGIGTFEEFFEVYTLKQLGRHKKSPDLIAAFDEIDPMLDYIKKYAGETADTNELRYAFLNGDKE